MTNTYFNSDKPQLPSHLKYTKDFIAGYESVKEKLAYMTAESIRDEFNLIHKGRRPTGMDAYYYSKGEFACIMDNI